MNRLLLLILLLVILMFVRSTRQKEGFLDASCGDYTNCVSCANKSNCTWCLSSKKCLTKSEIGNTDAMCNQINLVHTASMCQADPAEPSDATVANADMQGNPLYQDQVADKMAPPMVYLNKNAMYSPETVMANMNDVRNELQILKQSM